MDDLSILGGLFAIAFVAATILPTQSETALVGLLVAGTHSRGQAKKQKMLDLPVAGKCNQDPITVARPGAGARRRELARLLTSRTGTPRTARRCRACSFASDAGDLPSRRAKAVTRP